MRISEAPLGGPEKAAYFQVQISGLCLEQGANRDQRPKPGWILGPVMFHSSQLATAQYKRLPIYQCPGVLGITLEDGTCVVCGVWEALALDLER